MSEYRFHDAMGPDWGGQTDSEEIANIRQWAIVERLERLTAAVEQLALVARMFSKGYLNFDPVYDKPSED